jgi:DNA-binding transcriptional ArsR family regulator
MSLSSKARMSSDDQLDRLFRALADRTRRALLARLARRPAMVTELAKPFAMSLPAISRHIRVLEGAGLVIRTVDGRVHHCAPDFAPLRTVDAWLRRYRVYWDEQLAALARYVETDNKGRTTRG